MMDDICNTLKSFQPICGRHLTCFQMVKCVNAESYRYIVPTEVSKVCKHRMLFYSLQELIYLQLFAELFHDDFTSIVRRNRSMFDLTIEEKSS